MGHGLTDDPGALVGEQRFVDLRFVRGGPVERDVLGSQDEPLVRSQAPQTLVPCGRR
jgi:hypothetical protein